MNNSKITFGANPVNLIGKLVEVGDKAENFTAIDESLKPITLDEFSSKVKLISIFPSIDTSVCSLQTRKFNQEAAKFKNKVAFIALSADLPFALKRFCGAEGIDNLTPLSDHKDMDFGNKFGFHIKELRLLARGVIIIDDKNIVQYVEIVPEIGNEPNYEAAIAKLNRMIK
ncbi:MAG TPA: thiol peroxidase [Bacteroidales bacterium]|jgi:thiol peroxidase|nr:thiol peroxidase [Bacteroidales bacterium]